jgi:lipopolysaccharide export system protein LptA
MFLGNARIWQGNDFIRAERIEIVPDLRRLNASGRVQTLVIKSSASSPSEPAPIFGAGDRFEYDDSHRVVRYDGSASLRRGTARIEANRIIGTIGAGGTLEAAEAYDGVRVAQPGRTASGNSAVYVVAEELIVLKGTPAKIDDSINGSASGEELNIFLRERRVTSGSGGDSKNKGRVRSVYKTEKPR